MLRFLIGALMLLAGVGSTAGELPQAVVAQLRAADIPQDAVGVVVQRLSDGATLVSHGAERSLQPASTMKLVTALVALEKLGPAYRGRTELRTNGEVVDGVLKGDLVLRGLADVDFDWQSFEHMLRLLRLQGIGEIRGDLVLDRTFFKPARSEVGVAPFNAEPEFRYNVIPDALLINTYLVRLDLVSGGEELRVAMSPPLEKVAVAHDLALIERTCEDWEDGWVAPVVLDTANGFIQIRLRGNFPKHCTASTAISVLDRNVFADRLFRSTWSRLGGKFGGRTLEGEAPADTRLLAKHRSRTLLELTREIVKVSDNPTTRAIYLTLGALSDSDASMPTAQRADREVRAWFDRRGIGHDGLVLENGSGLSRAERIRPSQLAAVLRAALASEWAPELLASLPISAMQVRLRSSPAAGRARIKTGTLRDVSAVAGYVKDEANETYLVVALINHPLAIPRVARPILDALLDWVARAKERARIAP